MVFSVRICVFVGVDNSLSDLSDSLFRSFFTEFGVGFCEKEYETEVETRGVCE